MQVDATTLSDLEIFRSADGGPGLFATIAQTQTSVGSKAFRHRLKNALSDQRLGLLLLRQEKVPELIRRIGPYQRLG